MTTYGMTDDSVSKLREVLEFISANPHLWRQEEWLATRLVSNDLCSPETATECGTAGCVAGWLTILNHEVPETAWCSRPEGFKPGPQYIVSFAKFDVEETAFRILGADWDDEGESSRRRRGGTAKRSEELRHAVKVLFSSCNNLSDLWAIAEVISDGRVGAPDFVPAEYRRWAIERVQREEACAYSDLDY